MARVVNLKLVFRNWFFYNLIILTNLCKIQYLNLYKALLFPRNQAICLKNRKLWRALTTIKFNIFLLKFYTRFLLNNVYKRLFRIFLFCLDLELKRVCGDAESVEITQDINKITKIPNTLLKTLVSRKRVRSFSKIY